MYTSEIHGKTALIVGYGREGKSVEQWLARYYPSLRVVTTDQTNGADYLAHLNDFDTVIRSPGVSPFQPSIKEFIAAGGHMTSATNIFFSLVPGLVIGITGTKGKSTTASLIAHILSSIHADVRLVGNIGSPMLDHLDRTTKQTIYVVELSSHQLYDIRYSPHIAVVLPVVPEHQDYYPDVAIYAAAKANITKFQTEKDILVFDESNEFLRKLLADSVAKKLCYTSTDKTQDSLAWADGDDIILYGKEVVRRSGLRLRGNVHALLAASVVCDTCGVSPGEIGKAMQTFTPLPHRLEVVGVYNGVQYINDSLATIPEATVHALDALGTDVVTLIAGGFDRRLSYEALGKRLAKSSVTALILFPDTGKKIWESLVRAHATPSIQKYDVSSMEEAVTLAVKLTPKGKICLLSPASASFNLFRDYADRGDQFKEWVKKLGPGSTS